MTSRSSTRLYFINKPILNRLVVLVIHYVYHRYHRYLKTSVLFRVGKAPETAFNSHQLHTVKDYLVTLDNLAKMLHTLLEFSFVVCIKI